MNGEKQPTREEVLKAAVVISGLSEAQFNKLPPATRAMYREFAYLGLTRKQSSTLKTYKTADGTRVTIPED